LLVYDGTDARWENAAQSTITAGKATNLAGGAAGSLPYQSTTDTTTFLAAGSDGQVLKLASGVPTWSSDASGVTITDDTTTNATRYLTFTDATTGTETGLDVSSTKLTYNPSTGTLASTVVATNTVDEGTSGSGVTVDGVLLKDSEVTTDVINEKTSATGVTIDGVLLKDSQVTTDQINEKTSAAGVTIDSVLLKDGTVKATTTIGVGNATPAASGAGITFPATQSASSDANTLDDYEEGTWTVEIYDAFTGGNQSSTTGTGYYTKIGRAVTAQVPILNVNTSGMTAGNSVFYSLPLAASADNSVRAMGAALIRGVTFPAGYTSVACYVSAGNSRGVIEMSGSGVNSQAIIVSNILSGTSDIYATFMYYAD
jgi:hypothetical protein